MSPGVDTVPRRRTEVMRGVVTLLWDTKAFGDQKGSLRPLATHPVIPLPSAAGLVCATPQYHLSLILGVAAWSLQPRSQAFFGSQARLYVDTGEGIKRLLGLHIRNVSVHLRVPVLRAKVLA